jgi:hypothetical protein
MYSWQVFFTSLAGLLGVVISIVSTITYNNFAERRRLRVDCVRQLFRYSPSDDEYFKAFNEVPIIFHNAKVVLDAHKKVIDSGSLVGEEMADFLMVIVHEMGMSGASRQQLMQRFGTNK